ncbi:MAG TPA: DUF5691 domain-containing protein [Solirubrobacter sp.]|nr:DUF5691 domain-containing protein [Solirubrobacter sp.]
MEDRLLASAAAWTVARRAGARAGAPVVVTAADADPRPLCSAAAGERLRALLDGEHAELVPEWLALAARAGVRPPPELRPELLDHAARRTSLHAPVGAAAGPLGRWLADREPRWAFVRGAGDDVAEVWSAGDRDARRALLERLREADPAAARELLAGTFADETWEDREAFVRTLAHGLSDADEPFLEATLDDSRAPVRAAAAELLAALPRSRYAARMAARAAPLLRVADGRLVATLPGAPDAAAKRDGLEARGRRAERLTALLAATPLATWTGATPGGDAAAAASSADTAPATAAELVALPVGDDLGDAVHDGWAAAALKQCDAAWARALWRRDVALLAVLPRAEAEALAVAADDPFLASQELRGHWGPELSRAVIAHIRRQREAGQRPYHVGAAGYRLDPTVEPEAGALRELGGGDIWTLADVLQARAAMLRELS